MAQGSKLLGHWDRRRTIGIGKRECPAWAYIPLLLASSSCTEQPPQLGETVERTALPVQAQSSPEQVLPGQTPDPTDISLQWQSAAVSASRSAQESLVATVSNNTNRTIALRLVLESAGLDGQVAERAAGKFELPPLTSREVSVKLRDLPVQTEGSISNAVLEARYESVDGTMQVGTHAVYYRFRKSFSEVELYTVDDAAKLPNDGVFESDPIEVVGRVLSRDGTWIEVNRRGKSARAAATTGQPGLSGFRLAKELPRSLLSSTSVSTAIPAARARTTSAPPPASAAQVASDDITAAATTTFVTAPAAAALVRACGTWRVQFVDGNGTDFLSGTSYVSQPAAMAGVEITSADGATVYWSGFVDGNGCTPYLSLPAVSLKFVQYSITGWNGIRFDSFAQSNNTDVYAILTSAFLPPATGKFTYTFRPGTNNDAVQFAAMTGVLLKREADSQAVGGHGLGLVGGQYYVRSRASGGPCATGTSCTSGVNCYISTTLRNGAYPSHYKFLVTHEIAHAVQYVAMGVPYNQYDLGESSISLCRCDHVTEGGQLHCLQSREHITAAQVEGFAHAFGARAYNVWTNLDATFNYYKRFLETNGFIVNPPVTRDAFNPQNWMLNVCGAEMDLGVEWDWLSFFYNVQSDHAAYPTWPSDIYYMYSLACGGNCNGKKVTWAQLVAAAQMAFDGWPDEYARFTQTAWDHAVDF